MTEPFHSPGIYKIHFLNFLNKNHVMLENLVIYRMCSRMCVLDTHSGNVLARTPILFTYNRIHAKMEKTEEGSGGGALRKIFASHALQIAGKRLISFVIYFKLLDTSC